MRRRIAHYRRSELGPRDPIIGCVMLRDVQFFPEDEILPAPPDNGLLLRSDVHTLFDNGYLGVDPGYRLRVSPKLRTEFGNGESFYALAGGSIALPERRADRPSREFLEWHNDTVFRNR